MTMPEDLAAVLLRGPLDPRYVEALRVAPDVYDVLRTWPEAAPSSPPSMPGGFRPPGTPVVIDYGMAPGRWSLDPTPA